MTDSKKIARILRTLFGTVLCIGFLAVFAFAQTNKATISGSVTDAQGAIVADANVKVRNIATGAEREVTSNDEGFFEVPLLEIGTYSVTVTKQGFSTVIRENITLQTSTETRVDVQLAVGEISNQVTITAEAPLVQTETSERGSVISGREITELPLSGRNFTQLATLTPGVVRSNNVGLGGGPEARAFNNGDARSGSGGPGSSNENGSSESSRFNRSGGANISANGQRPTNNNFSLDGVDNNEPQFGSIGVFTNPDAIAEFKVSTSIPPAEVGRAAGAVITVTTKSGGNDFTGSLYYYGKNSALNAYHPVLKTKLAEALGRGNASQLELDALQKSVTQENEFGGTIGGPIVKDRTFFFFDYLGQRNNLPFPAQSVVPTVGSRNGDFRDFLRIENGQLQGVIFNPYTGQPFANNTIPANLQNPVGRAYLNAYPQPNRLGVVNPGLFCCSGQANFYTNRANQETINNYRIRIDHRFNDKNSINGSFNDQRMNTTRANLLPGLPTAGFGAGEERNNARFISISDVHAFKPNLLNEFRFGMTQIQISIFNCGVGGACGTSPTFAQDIGIPNSNDGSLEASGGALIGNFETGFLEFTGDGGLFQVKSKNPYFADTVTFIKGNHTTKFGGELRLRYLNTIDGGRTGSLKGQFQYGNTAPIAQPLVSGQVCPAESQTTVNGTPSCFVRPDGIPYGGAGNGQANILLGLPALFVSKSKIFGGPFDLQSQEWGFFVQDDWKVNDRLNLNLGLRYDIFTPYSEANGRYSLYSIADRRVNVASGGGDRLVKTDLNNFGPRIGFAYAINEDKTLVLRGGYGLLYTTDGVDYPPGVRNVPFSNSVAFNQNGNNTSPTATVFTLQSGPPTVPNAPDPANVPTSFAVFAVDEKQRVGMVNQFQLSMQYQFWRDYSIDIGYVGNRSSNLLYANNIGTGGTAQALNASGQFIGNGTLYTNGAESKYDGLQVQLQKRLSSNFQGQVSYTWSHTRDNSTGIFNGIGDQRENRSGPINPFDLEFDYGNSSLDVRHLLSASAIIDLPFGKGQRFLDQGGVVNTVFGGWQMNWIFSARSGIPFSVVTSGGFDLFSRGALANDPSDDVFIRNIGNLQRPILVGDPYANLQPGRILNAAAFSNGCAVPRRNTAGDIISGCYALLPGLTTVSNAAGNLINYGNLGRNTFRGPNQWFADLSLSKNTRITEKLRLQIGMDFFNVFNHRNFTVPSNNINNGDFGEIKYNSYGGRVIQYRARFTF